LFLSKVSGLALAGDWSSLAVKRQYAPIGNQMDIAANILERLLEAGFLLALPWPAWRLAMFRPFRYQGSKKAVALAGLLATYSLLVVAMAIFAPTLLRSLAILGFLAAIGLAWWMWRGSSRGRRALPGSFEVLPWGPYLDHRFYQRQAERYGPIFKMGSTLPCPSLRPTVCIVGHKAGLDLLRQHDDALQLWPPAPFSLLFPRGFLRYMNQDDHQIYNHLFRSAFSPKFLSDCSTAIDAEATNALSRMAADAKTGQADGIKPRPYLDQMLFAIFARVLLGIQPGSDAFTRLQPLYQQINIPRLTLRSSRKRAQENLGQLTDFLVQEAQRDRAGSGHSASLLSEIARVDPTKFDDLTILGNLIFMVESGCNDVGGLLMWVLKHLGDHPEWMQRLQDQTPCPQKLRSLADRIVSETLRLEQSEYLHRKAIRDLEFGDYVIPKGWLIRICIRDGHQDSQIFQDPAKFDPDRFIDKKFSHVEYAPFGLFRHMCVGDRLTHEIACTFLAVLAKSYDIEAANDGPPEHTRFHWAPNPEFRLRLTTKD
jgi:cytochrome P450